MAKGPQRVLRDRSYRVARLLPPLLSISYFSAYFSASYVTRMSHKISTSNVTTLFAFSVKNIWPMIKARKPVRGGVAVLSAPRPFRNNREQRESCRRLFERLPPISIRFV